MLKQQKWHNKVPARSERDIERRRRRERRPEGGEQGPPSGCLASLALGLFDCVSCTDSGVFRSGRATVVPLTPMNRSDDDADGDQLICNDGNDIAKITTILMQMIS